MASLNGRVYKGKSLFDFPSDYTVIDIETTGLYTGESEIIEVSAIKCRGDEAVDTFSTLIHPQLPISSFISDLTGITNELVKDAPYAKEALEDFYSFAGKDILVGHNVNFDVNFLYDELLLYNNLVLDN
ncbi:MAG: 3'-5' exonuclease, partial [Clostridia bacterium]|nr:3'-5' exonuclease [Clostridia bacterium]